MITRRIFLTNAGALLAAAAVRPAIRLRLAKEKSKPATLDIPLLLGVDYYPDQTPESLWEEDARMIADFGFTNVRVAEFAWSLMEPSEGKFDFAWLLRSIEILPQARHRSHCGHAIGGARLSHGCTAKYPEVLMVNDEGMALSPGGRRFTCPTNKTYRRMSLAIASGNGAHLRRNGRG